MAVSGCPMMAAGARFVVSAKSTPAQGWVSVFLIFGNIGVERCLIAYSKCRLDSAAWRGDFLFPERDPSRQKRDYYGDDPS